MRLSKDEKSREQHLLKGVEICLFLLKKKFLSGRTEAVRPNREENQRAVECTKERPSRRVKSLRDLQQKKS